MRISRGQLRAVLAIAVTLTSFNQLSAAAGPRGLVKRIPDVGTETSIALGAVTHAASIDNKEGRTKDAPVDGKDGRPHAGPFVETEAERDRKKAKEKGAEVPTSEKKPRPGDAAGALPESNEGVMDDKSRSGPKEGQRGTEGGISEKSKEKSKQDALGAKTENKPEHPKEAPPLPHSEAKKIEASDKGSSKDDKKAKTDSTEEEKGKKAYKGDEDKAESGSNMLGLSKPADLPDKLDDRPLPVPVGSGKTDHLAISKPTKSNLGTDGSMAEDDGLIQPFHSFVLSLTMILVSEIGDKTFLVAALMAMKHPPLFVFSAAYPALIVMTVGSAIMGHAAPLLLPPRLTNFAAAILFLIFGAKMLSEGRAMSPDEGVGEEMREVESELEEKEAEAARYHRRRDSNASPYLLEGGRKAARLPARADSPPGSPDNMRSRSPAKSGLTGYLNGAQNLFSLLLSPAWVQTFVMTFLGEWGDRSQIATIAMAAGQNYWSVTLGALVGHCICTGIAVIGGRAIAGRVSMRTVTLGGAIAFIVFGLVYLAEAFYYK